LDGLLARIHSVNQHPKLPVDIDLEKSNLDYQPNMEGADHLPYLVMVYALLTFKFPALLKVFD
jgi:hypothetical protein